MIEIKNYLTLCIFVDIIWKTIKSVAVKDLVIPFFSFVVDQNFRNKTEQVGSIQGQQPIF